LKEHRLEVMVNALQELNRINDIHEPFRNENEAIGVLLEEFDELKKELFVTHDLAAAYSEAIQVAAVGMKIAIFVSKRMEAEGQSNDIGNWG